MKVRISMADLSRLAARDNAAAAALVKRGERCGGGWLEVEAEAPETARLRGLGDLVAVVAKPVARVVDAVAGTDLEHCGGCAERQAALNALLPL